MRLSSLKTKMPWRFKVLAKMILSRLPAGYRVWQELNLFRHGCMDDSGYVLNVFKSHVNRAKISGRLAGKKLLELGPGDSIGTAIVAASYGAQAILVDSGKFAISNIQVYKDLAKELSLLGLTPPDISSADTLDDVLSICGAEYHTCGLASLKSIEAESIDFIFSQAVLEHIRKHEFLDTMFQCRRILVAGGNASHRVDLKDHLGGGLNNLRFNEQIWESDFFVKSGFYTNRIRLTMMLELFEKAGFNVQLNEVRRWERLPVEKYKLAKEYATLTDDELCVSGFDVILS